jgi:hypothetical protein
MGYMVIKNDVLIHKPINHFQCISSTNFLYEKFDFRTKHLFSTFQWEAVRCNVNICEICARNMRLDMRAALAHFAISLYFHPFIYDGFRCKKGVLGSLKQKTLESQQGWKNTNTYVRNTRVRSCSQNTTEHRTRILQNLSNTNEHRSPI